MYRDTPFISRSARTLGRLLLLIAISACGDYAVAQNQPMLAARGTTNAQPTTNLTVGEDYTISPDDVLDIYVVDVTELSRTYRVGPTGTINLPFIARPLAAAGLTLPQLSDSIKAALHASGVVMNALVTVSVQQSRLHSVAVTGAVKHPQIYPLYGRATLLDVLSQAEGLAPDAGDAAIIHRGDIAVRALSLDGGDDAARSSRVDITQVMEAGDASANVVIYPGDRVTVPKAGIVYVAGAFNKPGGYPIRPNRAGMTVMQAVALAEDVKSTARRDQAMIVRVDSQAADGRRQIPVNLKKILAGQTPDPTLQSEDILFVPDSIGKKAMRRSLEVILQMSTALAIYKF